MSHLTTGEAAKLLGVSGATVRNWCRAGYLAATAMHPLSFAMEEVLRLKERIRTNRFNRLRKRANKSASDKLANPDVHDAEIAADLANIIQEVTQAGVDAAVAMFVAALHVLQAEDETSLPHSAELEPERLAWRRPAVRDTMLEWRRRIDGPILRDNKRHIEIILGWQDCEDRLGILYQGLSSVGKRSRTGAYFTPGHIIDDSLTDLGTTPASFLDPCCGTGRYLIRAAMRFNIDPERLYGFDSDPVAADIARINLLLLYRDLTRVPAIRCLDSLSDLATGHPECDTNHLLGSIDAIATNPPWGGSKNQIRTRSQTEMIRSGESFSLFLEKSLRLLREGGLLSFVLPEAMLKIKAHADIRRLLLAETRIRKIILLGRVFSGVFTPIMRLDVEKLPAPPDWTVQVVRRRDTHICPQSRFSKNTGHAFDIAVTPRDEELLGKIYDSEHITLRNNADWALGVVTGDNGRCVLDAPVHGSEPVLRGRDVFKFAPRQPRCHIVFQPEAFQQVAPERHYRAPEKLIYRFVSDRLIFAYDDRGLLTLNSANILIPRLPGMSIKSTLAFLNSRVFQYIFTKRFRTRKILRGDLETLPFPRLSGATLEEIEKQVDRCMSGDYKPADELDRMVFDAFGLDETDIAAMEDSMAEEAGVVIL